MKSIGIILAGGNNNRIGRLSDKRAIAALPVAGSYRAIDFTLSNMSNSRVSKVAVLPQFNARSLNEHLSSSKWWDFGRKQLRCRPEESRGDFMFSLLLLQRTITHGIREQQMLFIRTLISLRRAMSLM